MSKPDLCPCGSQKNYEECCQPFIEGKQLPPTAEGLMRSRYSAYVKQAYQYVYDSYHKDTKKHFTLDAIEEQSQHIQWLGLEVHDTSKGTPNDKTGIVNFAASYQMSDGKIHKLTERSHFVKEGDRWLYLNGETKFTTETAKSTKVGRNEPCPCGSGKKYKKCCGAA